MIDRRAVLVATRRWAPVGVVVAFWLWVAWPFLRTDGWITSFDTVAYSGPNLSVTFEAVRDGRVAHWNDLVFGGVNHIGNPQTSAMYPLLWVMAWFDVHRAMMLTTALHLAVIASGTWVLVRRFPASRAAASVAAITLLGSGLVMARTIQFEQISVIAWIPWVLAGVDAVITSPRPWRAVALAAVAAALMATAGHPQQTYLAVPVVAAWAVGRMVDLGAHRRAGHLAAAGALALGLAASQLLPVASALDEAARTGSVDLAVVSNPSYSIDLHRLPVLLLGDPTSTNHPATAGSNEPMAFVGAVAAALAILAVATTTRDHRTSPATVALLVACAAGALVLAMGPRTFVYRTLYDHLPGFGQARSPGRWMVAATLPVALLAGLATERIRAGGLDRRRVAASTGLAVVALGVAVLGPFDLPSASVVAGWFAGVAAVGAVAWWRSAPPTADDRSSAAGPAAAAGAWAALALLALVIVELGLAQRHSLGRTLRQPTSITELADDADVIVPPDAGRVLALTDDRLGEPPYLVETLRPNANVLTETPSFDGYDGGVQITKRWVDAGAALTARPFNLDLTIRSQAAVPVDTSAAARLGVRWVLLETQGRDPEVVLPGWEGPVAVDGSLELYENPDWMAEARLVAEGVPLVDDRTEVADQLLDLPLDAVALEDDDLLDDLRCERSCRSIGVDLARGDPGRLGVDLDGAADGTRVLVVDERYDPGWSVTVDGRSRPAIAVDRAMLGVVVGPDDDEVRFSYTAPGFRLGLPTTLVAAVAAAALALWPVRRRTSSAG